MWSEARTEQHEAFIMSDLKTEVADIITGGGCQVERWDEALDRADEIIDLLRTKLTGEWVSTKDAMPEIHEYVLLMADRYWNTPEDVPEMKVTATGYLQDYNNGLFWSVFGERGMDLDAFTHWMPIPASS